MTDKLQGWSTTAASNNMASPEGFPEGMAPSTVNDSARQIMKRLREWYEDAQWINLGHTVNSATGSTIVFAGDVSAFYPVNRVVRSDGVIGYVTSCSVATNTTVVLSGITFAGAPTLFEISILSDALIRTLGNFAVGGALTLVGTVPTFALGGILSSPAANFDGHSNVTLAAAHANPLIYAWGYATNAGLAFGYNVGSVTKASTGTYDITPETGSWPNNVAIIGCSVSQVAFMVGAHAAGGGPKLTIEMRDAAGNKSDSQFAFIVLVAV